jgi:hypothetical protein
VVESEEDFAAEVAELHRFFEDWFSGSGERRIQEFSDRLDPNFAIVGPNGIKNDKDEIVRAVEARAGGYDVSITTTDAALDQAEPLMIGTYREQHVFNGDTTHRVATAVMIADESAPTGYRWMSVHETWIEGDV